jgi:hypothetical protein
VHPSAAWGIRFLVNAYALIKKNGQYLTQMKKNYVYSPKAAYPERPQVTAGGFSEVHLDLNSFPSEALIIGGLETMVSFETSFD